MGILEPRTYYIIGMSPGNSYFKDEEIRYLLKTTVERFGRVSILIADVPAISTYVALGYSENRARRDKAIPKGNALKNRVLKIMLELGYTSDIVRIFDWEKEIENNEAYKMKYLEVLSLYDTNKDFYESVRATTRAVLEGSKRDIENIEQATSVAVHYLLSELAFLEFAPEHLGVEKVVYVYHKNWRVYEDYLAGRFDTFVRPHLDFLLIENPYETYNPMWGLEDDVENSEFKDTLDRIQKTKTLRVGFASYFPAFTYAKDSHSFSGIFYEILDKICKKYAWQMRFSEEIGYGVIVDGLNSDRFDIFGSTVWPTIERKQAADFSASLYKSPVFTWIRSDYGKTEDEIRNNEHARVAVKENDISDSIARMDFVHNRQVRVPQLSDATDVLRFVAEGRADFTFAEPYFAEVFNKISAVKLVIASEHPIRVYENAIMFKQGETALKELFDKEFMVLKRDGTIAGLVKQYTGSENTFILE